MTPLSISLLFAVAACGLAVKLFIGQRKKYFRVNHLMAELASRRNGTAEKEYGQTFLVLSFLHRGIKVTVKTLPKKGNQPEQIKISVHLATHRLCKIGFYRNEFFTKPILKNLKRIKTGVEKFDTQIVVKTDDDFFANSIIAASLENMLLSFDLLPLELNFENIQFTATIYKIPEDQRGYTKVIDLALLFCDRLRELKDTEGII